MFQSEIGTTKYDNYNKYRNAMVSSTCTNSKQRLSDFSQEYSDDSYEPFKNRTKNFQISQSTKRSVNSESTHESTRLLCKDSECDKVTDRLEGLENEYNFLISQNESRETNHFTILNENIRNLLNKKKNKRVSEKTVSKTNPHLDNNLCEEVSLVDLTHILNNSSTSYFKNALTTSPTNLEMNHWIDSEPTLITPCADKNECEDETSQHHIIPEKFRKKKLPYLDKKIKTGYVKFFDDKNHFGFMNLTTEPFGEVFVFGKEFEKANINPKIVSVASNNPEIVFKFRVMYYMGKHGESKKAVNIRLSNC